MSENVSKSAPSWLVLSIRQYEAVGQTGVASYLNDQWDTGSFYTSKAALYAAVHAAGLTVRMQAVVEDVPPGYPENTCWCYSCDLLAQMGPLSASDAVEWFYAQVHTQHMMFALDLVDEWGAEIEVVANV